MSPGKFLLLVASGLMLAVFAPYVRHFIIHSGDRDDGDAMDGPGGHVNGKPGTPTDHNTQGIAANVDDDKFDKSRPQLVWLDDSLSRSERKVITCSKGSCLVVAQTGENKKLYINKRTRAILVYGTTFQGDTAPLPRLPHHMWALLHEESPKNNAFFSHEEGIALFNITSTFRQESDLPLVLQFLPNLKYLLRPAIPMEKKNEFQRGKEDLAPVVYIQSTCENPSYRDVVVRKLMKYVKVDALGACLHNRDLPGEYSDANKMFDKGFYDLISRYKFAIAFENALCKDYITEKLWRPLHLGTVPIYRGAPNVRQWLPSEKSALVFEEFVSAEKLGEMISYLDSNDTAYNEYLEYKKGEEFITNTRLKHDLKTRVYSAENFAENPDGFFDDTRPDFISAFECKTCDRVHQRISLEDLHRENGLPPPAPWIANLSHSGCPMPENPAAHKAEQDHDMWVSTYLQAKAEAIALTRMIQTGREDTTTFQSEKEDVLFGGR